MSGETFEFSRIVLREVQLSLREPFRISSGDMSHRRILLLEVSDSDGAQVWSECVAGDLPNYSPETVDTAWLAIREWLAPRVLGKRLDLAALARSLGADIRGHEMARAAVEMAGWALLAERHGKRLASVLGGTRERIATGISIGLQPSPDRLVDKARAALGEGYRKLKIKIKPGADVEYLTAVRDALGDEAPLMADANSAYTLDDSAHLCRLDELGLMMIEQPLGADDLVRHAELQRRLQTPVCLDESIVSVAKAEDMIQLGSGRIVNIKPGRVAGFAEAKAIHDVCAEAEIPVWCGGMLETGIGRAYNVALASLPNFVFPGDVSPSARYWKRDLVHPEWTMDETGWVAVPESPGLGVEVDAERIAALTVRQETLTA